jgi:serine/threonine protein kinase
MESEECIDSKYYKVAATLMQTATRVFDSEEKRALEFTSIIQELGKNFLLETLSGLHYRTDRTVVVNGFHIVSWELKNEFYTSRTCPVSQNNAYFVHLQKERRERDRSPMLLVNVVGCHHLQVFGATWNGERCMCVDPLYPPISLLFVPRDPAKGVSKLAKLLSVIDKTMNELVVEYYHKPIEERERYNRGPYWTDNGHLEYEKRLTRSVVWLLEGTYDEQQVVVKFVRSHYGEAVHKLLGDSGFAPKLVCCQSLPGGWYAVVMEKLDGKHIDTDSINDRVKQSLKGAVNLMHEKNYVHGDLRSQNILIVNDTVRILDFDWADTEDTAEYPPELNMSSYCNWHPDVEPGGKILKSHDIYQIDIYMKK